MSKYVEYAECHFKDKASLIAALLALGWRREEIVEGSSLHLEGYHGDRRPETAEIVVRRAHVNRLSGGMSNDLGFHLVDGEYRPIVSEYDGRALTTHVQSKLGATGTFVQALTRAYHIALIPKLAGRLGLYLQPAVRSGQTLRYVGTK